MDTSAAELLTPEEVDDEEWALRQCYVRCYLRDFGETRFFSGSISLPHIVFGMEVPDCYRNSLRWARIFGDHDAHVQHYRSRYLLIADALWLKLLHEELCYVPYGNVYRWGRTIRGICKELGLRPRRLSKKRSPDPYCHGPQREKSNRKGKN